jgi:hypothetical protein
MADVFCCGSISERHHRQSACQRLERHIAIGLGQAREQKNVSGGVMCSEILTAAHASENDVRAA